MLDYLLKNGKIVDGSGTPWFKGEIGVANGKIAYVGPGEDLPAHNVIDVQGEVIAPGFIDAHTHDDLYLLASPQGEVKLRQGVTSVIIGNCGLAPVPINKKYYDSLKNYTTPILGESGRAWDWTSYEDFLDRYSVQGTGLNLAFLAAHGPLRIAVMGFAERTASTDEITTMKKLLREAMEAGAVGLSTGLLYAPGCYADLHELVELAKVVAEYGGVYVSHIRGEGATLEQSVREAITVGERAGLPVHVSHLKAAGRANWGKINGILELMRESRAKGIDVTCDVYPYTAGSTMLSTLLPPWVLEGGMDETLRRLHDPEERSRVKNELARPGVGWDNIALAAGWDNIVVSSVASLKNKECEGKSMLQVAEARGETPEEAAMDLLCEENGRVMMVAFLMSEDEVRQVIQSDYSMFGSDGLWTKEGKPHPRLYGTFPRIFAKYVREAGVLNLERAVQKVTAFPATRFGLEGKGYLKPGMDADITVFDPDTIADTATYLEPCQFPRGITHVFVNGRCVLKNETIAAVRCGRVLRRYR